MEELEYIKIPLRGARGKGKYTLVDGDYDGEYFSTMKLWFSISTGYVQTKVEGKTVNLHTLICRPKKGLWVDHIDRDRLNNRSCNLRLVTPSENTRNSDRYDSLPHYTPEEKRAKRLLYRRRPDVLAKKAEYDKKRLLAGLR